jgi:hypothetical protein
VVVEHVLLTEVEQFAWRAGMRAGEAEISLLALAPVLHLLDTYQFELEPLLKQVQVKLK